MMGIKQQLSLKLSSSFKNIFLKTKGLKKTSLVFFPGVIASVIVAFIVPLFFIIYSTYIKKENLSRAQERIASLEIKAKKTALIRSRAALFIKQLQGVDKEFLAHQIERLIFLQKEKNALEFFSKTPVFKESYSLAQRKEELEKNTIIFEEIGFHEKESIQERLYAIKHPIEMDFNDLERLLNTIENPLETFSHGRPQLIFQKFTLKKKQISHTYELLECDFKLIERKSMEKL